VANDGGQVYMGAPEVIGEVGPATPFERSDLLAYELTDQYTYAAGDATKAYAKSKVREFTRAFLHLRPDLFVVFDRVESTNPAFKKRWLLHSVNEAEVSGPTFTVSNGPGRLWGKTLLPREVTYENIGGPGKEFWVDGKNWPPQKAVRDDTGRWRLEVSPAKPATQDYFLHVLYACSSSSTTYPSADVAETEAQVTATITQDGTTYVVTFSKAGAAPARLTGSVRIVASDGKVLLDRPLATKVLLDKQQ
jgi:heparin/heparan-sulfate lyase